MLTNQLVLNAGIDYTFGVGSGLYVAYEQLYASYDETPFKFSNTLTFSLLTMNYPLGLFDKLSTIIYYNWTDNDVYSFLNWQRHFDNTMFYLMAYWNPDTFQLAFAVSFSKYLCRKRYSGNVCFQPLKIMKWKILQSSKLKN